MPKYEKEIKELNAMRTNILLSSNPYHLNAKQLKDFTLVINTLLYIANDENLEKLKTKSGTFFPGANTDEQINKYVPIHFEAIHARVSSEIKETKIADEIYDGVEKYLMGSLVTAFITSYKNITTVKIEEPRAKMLEERIMKFCDLLDGHCIDKRTILAIDYGLKLTENLSFTELVLDAFKNITITNFFHGVEQLIEKKWGEPFREDKNDNYCSRKGIINHETFTSIQLLLNETFTPNLSEAEEIFLKFTKLKRHLFIDFLSVTQPELLHNLIISLMKKHPQLALEVAVLGKQPSLINNCIRASACLNHANERNKTPIQLAAEAGHWSCVNAILEAQPFDAKNKARYGNVLPYAVKGRQGSIVKKLIAAKVSVNHPDADGLTALHYALHQDTPDKEEKTTMKDWLIAAKADVNVAHLPNSITPLIYAAQKKEISLASFNWLLEQKNISKIKQDSQRKTALEWAAHYGDRAKTNALVRPPFSIPEEAKFAAAANGFFEIFFDLATAEGLSFASLSNVNTLINKKFDNCNNIFHLIAKANRHDLLEKFKVDNEGIIKLNYSKLLPIDIAAQEGNWETVRKIVTLWPLFIGNFKGILPYAAKAEKWELVHFLLEKQIPTNEVIATTGFSAFHYALEQNNIIAATLLLEAGADINICETLTPLAFAAKSKEVSDETFEWLLLQDNLKCHGGDKNFRTPLYFASIAGNTLKVALFKRIAENREAIVAAVENGKFDILAILLADPGSHDFILKKLFAGKNSLLHFAIKFKQPLTYIERLLKKGFLPYLNFANEDKQTPIEIAAQQNEWKTVRFIANLQPDEKNEAHYGQALLTAIKAQEWKTAHQLLDAKALTTIFDENGLSVLHYTILANENSILQKLLDAKVDVNIQAKSVPNPTPLLTATSSCVHLDTFKKLYAQSSCWVDITNANDETALMLLATHIEEEKKAMLAFDKTKILLQRVTYLGKKNKYGKSALMIAAEEENIAILRLLLSYDRGWIAYSFENDETLLHQVAKMSHESSIEILKELIKSSSIIINRRNTAGETALFLAAKHGPIEKVVILLQITRIDKYSKRADGKTACGIAVTNDIAFLLAQENAAAILKSINFDFNYVTDTLKNCRDLLPFLSKKEDEKLASDLREIISQLDSYLIKHTKPISSSPKIIIESAEEIAAKRLLKIKTSISGKKNILDNKAYFSRSGEDKTVLYDLIKLERLIYPEEKSPNLDHEFIFDKIKEHIKKAIGKLPVRSSYQSFYTSLQAELVFSSAKPTLK